MSTTIGIVSQKVGASSVAGWKGSQKRYKGKRTLRVDSEPKQRLLFESFERTSQAQVVLVPCQAKVFGHAQYLRIADVAAFCQLVLR
jgi:hypothetical protein